MITSCCRLGRCVEHMSAGGQLAPGFSALRLEFESLTIADHLRRRAPAHGLRTDPGFGLGLRTAASEGDGWEEHMAPTAAAGLLALIQEAVGLEVCNPSVLPLCPDTAPPRSSGTVRPEPEYIWLHCRSQLLPGRAD